MILVIEVVVLHPHRSVLRPRNTLTLAFSCNIDYIDVPVKFLGKVSNKRDRLGNEKLPDTVAMLLHGKSKELRDNVPKV